MQRMPNNSRGGNEAASRREWMPYALIGFLALCLVPVAFAWSLMRSAVALTLQNDTFTYIPLIPVVSAYLIYTERKKIFSPPSYGWMTGGPLTMLGAAGLVVARFNFFEMRPINQISLLMLALVFIWAGAFAIFFGGRSFRAASFPLLFLLFAIPIPEPTLSQIILLLQQGSASATAAIFQMFNVPFVRQDLVFELPGVAIRIAEECSGIRSSLALLITTVLASHFFLRTGWRKLVLCILVVPVVILKNGLRIATLSTLAIYVNPGFLYGRLHHQGGVVFFLIALLPMAFVLLLLQKSENKKIVPPTTARTPITAITALKDGE
jgi:exosortase